MVTPAQLHFESSRDEQAESKLLAELARRERDTLRLPITKPEDVELHANFCVHGKYQLTRFALKSLCTSLSRGLGQVVADVGGVLSQAPGGRRADAVDPELAAKLLNRVIILRFARLRSHTLIIDQGTRTVEGVVGSRYAYLSNKDLVARVHRFLERQGEGEFCGASLYGRRMTLRYRLRQPDFVLAQGHEQFYSGYHLVNSEVGDAAVRCSSMIVRRWGGVDYEAVSPHLEGGKLMHVRGAKFDQRLRRVFERLRDKARETRKLAPQLQVLRQAVLGLGGSPPDHKRRLQHLTLYFSRRYLTRELTEKVMNRVLSQGSYDQGPQTAGCTLMELYAARTAYDVFSGLLQEARQQRPDVRERLEQLAYQLLVGNVKID